MSGRYEQPSLSHPSHDTLYKTRLRVSWYDTDASGRIHFTSVFRWAEAAERELLREAGVDPATSINFPRRYVEAEYLAPLRFDDAVELRLAVVRLGRTSIGYAWEVHHRGQVAVKGQHTVVRVDETSGQPHVLDEGMRRALSRIHQKRATGKNDDG